MEFQDISSGYVAVALPFSVIDGFWWFFMGNLHRNIQLITKFLKAPFLVLQFSHYTLMSFLMMCSVILLSMLILFSPRSVTRHLVCGNNQNWDSELESDLRDTVDCDRKWLVDFNVRKTQLLLFGQSNNTCAIHVKIISLLNWIVSLTLALLLKLPPSKLEG